MIGWVIAVEFQGHGHTADVDRPLSVEQMADDTAAPLRKKGHASQSLQQIEHQLA
jgi:hypothetical protein